jgi:hypothetical protein
MYARMSAIYLAKEIPNTTVPVSVVGYGEGTDMHNPTVLIRPSHLDQLKSHIHIPYGKSMNTSRSFEYIGVLQI